MHVWGCLEFSLREIAGKEEEEHQPVTCTVLYTTQRFGRSIIPEKKKERMEKRKQRESHERDSTPQHVPSPIGRFPLRR